nr:MAG TPA_asm: hypothetical protein [Caudoviricetes sp.]
MSRLNDAKTELERYELTKPGAYQSQYKPKIDSVMGKLEGLGDFDYDPDADTAYKQYKDQYSRNAQKANRNAQANAAALTGGYTSSYGTQAGQNAYDATMANLDDVLDGLYDQSLGEYNAKKNGLETELAGLQRAESSDRQTYQQKLDNWYDGLEYRQNEYDSAYNEQQQKKANGIQTATNFGQLLLSAAPWIIKGILALLGI